MSISVCDEEIIICVATKTNSLTHGHTAITNIHKNSERQDVEQLVFDICERQRFLLVEAEVR